MNKGLAGDLSGLPEHGLIVVGFSGGADSTALAHWLFTKTDPGRLVLAHVNHMLRGEEADRDEAAARAFARKLGLRFVVSRTDVAALAAERGIGLEECGRAVRYDFFHSLAAGEDDRIVTAHNADDNAETMLLNLCRGAGLSGLCGIPYQRGKVLRPFLKVRREEIEAYCAANDLSYVTDSSNFSTSFARNKLRLEVLPVLRQLNPQAVQALGQTAELLSRDRDFLLEEAEKLLKSAERKYGLDVSVLKAAPEALRAAAAKKWLERLGCRDLERRHLELLEDCMQKGGALTLPGGTSVKCAGGLLFTVPKEKPPAFSLPLELPECRSETVLPGGKVLILEKRPGKTGKTSQKIHNLDFKNALDYDIIIGNFQARTRRAGDRFSFPGRGLSKPLKQALREAGVPADRRDGVLLLECDGRLAFCEGLGAAEGFQVTGGTGTVLWVTVRENVENESKG